MIALRPRQEVLGVLQLHLGRAVVVAYFVVVPRVSHPGNDHRSLVAAQFLEDAVVVDPLDLAEVVDRIGSGVGFEEAFRAGPAASNSAVIVLH